MRLTLNRDYETSTRDPHPEVKTPEYFPARMKVVRSAKMIHCVTDNTGVTRCFGTSARSGGWCLVKTELYCDLILGRQHGLKRIRQEYDESKEFV